MAAQAASAVEFGSHWPGMTTGMLGRSPLGKFKFAVQAEAERQRLASAAAVSKRDIGPLEMTP
jgi:hypothetical protein